VFPQVAVFDVGDTMSDLLNGRTFYAAVTEPVAPATCTETAATSVQADDDACGDAELDLSTDTACHAVQVSVKRLFLFRLPHAARRCFQDRLRTLTDVATASLSTDIVYLVLSCLVLSCLVLSCRSARWVVRWRVSCLYLSACSASHELGADNSVFPRFLTLRVPSLSW
jgi:hypothetical protein